MLEATRCSLAGLCFCLLAISAAALPSTIFCCTFLPLLLFGCPLLARFLIPSQAKPVAVKRHRKRVRLKRDTVANDSMGVSVQEALASDTTRDAFAFHAELWNTGCRGASAMAVVVALLVAGIVATSLAPAALAAMRTGDSDAIPFHSGSKCRSVSGNGLRSSFIASLGSDAVDRSGYGGGDRLGWGDGGRLGCIGGDRLDSGAGGQLRCEGGSRPGHDSCGGGQLGGSGGGRLGWGGGDRLGGGTPGCGGGGQLGCNGRSRLRCAGAHSDRLGSDGGDRLGRDGGDGLSYDNDEGLRVGGSNGFSVGRLGYVDDDRKAENDGGTVGNRTAARKGSGSALLARMLFDKDNPVDRKKRCDGGEREGCMIPATPG